MLTTQFTDDTIRKDDEPILMKDRRWVSRSGQRSVAPLLTRRYVTKKNFMYVTKVHLFSINEKVT